MQANQHPIKISFVIPVYNAEKYLKECIDSIVCQLEGNELILINDGSTDSSGQICDDYACSYDSISVLHIENHGVAYARNLGVDRAIGEYIVFLDADDYINKDFSDCFHKQSMDADVIFYSIRKQFGEKTFVPMGDGLKKDRLVNRSPFDVLDYIASCPKFPASPCGKLVRRDLLDRHHICFPLNIGHEDYDWTYLLLRFGESYDFFEEGMYTYRQLSSSRSSMRNPRNLQAHIDLIERWATADVPEGFRVHLNVYLAYQYAMALAFWGSLSTEQRKQYYPRMKQYQYLLRLGRTRKIKLIYAVVSLLGTENTACLLYRYVHIRNKRLGSE